MFFTPHGYLGVLNHLQALLTHSGVSHMALQTNTVYLRLLHLLNWPTFADSAEQVRDAKWTRPSLPVEGLAPRLEKTSTCNCKLQLIAACTGQKVGIMHVGEL